MLVTLYPGVNRFDVPDTLRRIASEAQDASNTSGPAYDRLTAYLAWATNAVRMLEHRVSAADIDRLVLTRGYERLLSTAGSLTGLDVGTQRLLNGLLSLEIQQRINALDLAVKDLDTQIQLWSGFAAFTVPDTSFYLKHEHKLKSIDFHAELGAPREQQVRVIIPMVVLDELDRLKDSGDQHTRWRAGHTLGVMDEAFAATPVPRFLHRPTAGPPMARLHPPSGRPGPAKARSDRPHHRPCDRHARERRVAGKVSRHAAPARHGPGDPRPAHATEQELAPLTAGRPGSPRRPVAFRRGPSTGESWPVGLNLG